MAGEKPFDPTPARLARAKREGDVPRSRDVAALASFVAAGFAFGALREALGAAAREAMRAAARGTIATGAYVALASGAAAVAACALCGGVTAAGLEGGGFTVRAVKLDLARLAPAAGLKRMFGRDAALGIAKAFVTALVVGAAVAFGARDASAAAGAGNAFALASVVGRALGSAFAGAALVAATFAAADAAVERAKWRRRLRMSFDEIKREHQANEGDPHLRGRRRAAHRNLVRGSIGSVRDAAFVVANPTHVAVALAYGPPDVPVPCVLVRAVDDGALAVKARAHALGIPVITDVALARALLASTAVGDPIPRDTYGAIATIVAALARAGTHGR